MSCPDFSVGPANQTQIPADVHNLPSSIAPNAAVNSNLITVQGYTKVAAALTSSQNGTLSIQRFLDPNGTVRVGNPTVVDLVAGSPASLTVDDGQMFGSFQITVTNEAGTTALLANIAVAVAADPATPAGASTGSYQNAVSTEVSVPKTAGGAVLFSANPNAKFRSIRNPQANTAAVWISLSANPTSGQGIFDLQPGDEYEMSIVQGNLYPGTITGIADSAAPGSQTILVTEGT